MRQPGRVAPETITIAQARRTALAAQGLARRRPDRPGARVTMAGVQRVLDRLQVLQIDSVNVLARAHLVPLYARLGPYDVGLLDRAAGRAPRRVVEAWAHEASYVPVDLFPSLAFRRASFEKEAWGNVRSVVHQHPDVVEQVREVVREAGPVTASQVHELFEHEHPRTREAWGWNWTVAKRALELLFFTGEVLPARRNAAFERCYDLAERVLPPAVLAAPTPPPEDQVRRLVEIAARAHGVATRRDLADYYRVRGPLVDRAIEDLVEEGTLRPVTVRGWDATVWAHREATFPRVVDARTLLSPFDPLVFERSRLEELFGTRYRIEIYVPAAKRVHGYYVLPFLQGDAITARVDLKADRAAGVLRVLAAHDEPGTRPDTTSELAAELGVLAGWLGLDGVVVEPVGALAAALAVATRSTGAQGSVLAV